MDFDTPRAGRFGQRKSFVASKRDCAVDRVQVRRGDRIQVLLISIHPTINQGEVLMRGLEPFRRVFGHEFFGIEGHGGEGLR